jgi:tripartite-type tricarboxylate transporter receptor subunit TctC
LVAPKKTPAAVVEKLRELTARAAKDPAFSETIEKLGGEVQFMDGNELGTFWEKESAEMTKLLTVLHKEGVKID